MGNMNGMLASEIMKMEVGPVTKRQSDLEDPFNVSTYIRFGGF
jgi:hypothetical protein